MSKQIDTSIEIQASASEVWSELTAFESFSEWNPFIRNARGVVEPGGKLEVFIRPAGARGMTFRPTVIVVEPERTLRWYGRFLVPWLFDGEHTFRIESLSDNHVRFHHSETFSGVLVPLLWRTVGTNTRRGFEDMNRALKARVERNARATKQ